MRFFERFRSAIARYADGVHQLEPPATRAAVDEAERRLGRALPDDYRDFLLQWDGGFLFHDDYELHGAARLTLDGERLRIGEAPGATLFLDGRGRLIAVDAQTEAERVEGSRFERWLDATMAREAVLYDRDGEFRDDAFDGGEVSERARRKRAQGAAKVDPESPAWREEQAELFVEEGARERAIAEYERAAA